MDLGQITPIILTYNEAPNIGRVLDRLGWAHRVVVVDSGSDDGTLDLLRNYPNVTCVKRPFDTHAAQWNFALEDTGIETEWVLALDADYVLDDEFVAELRAMEPEPGIDGYSARVRYMVHGRALRSALYPPVTTLYRRVRGRYDQDGHTQRLTLKGSSGRLGSFICHDDRKPFERWLWAQARYSRLERDVMLARPWRKLSWRARIRRTAVIAPWMIPLVCVFVRGGLLDGWPGIHYAFQRGIAESMLAFRIIEARIGIDEGAARAGGRR